MAVSVQFINGVDEEISGISLRKGRQSGTKTVVLFFERVLAMEKGRSFVNQVDRLWLRDEEGEIEVTPNGIKFKFVDDDNLAQAECAFDVMSEEAWERVMRFLHRYAEAHGFEFQTPGG
ncbi:photosystem II reaction center protein Psb28 [Phormidium sp. CCY1219]|uniref:photosystem II reaction center protein Psb28 n=1 Tax=Phormidium sp. CCY1219 TaxID=2886104 RepID=UPI002D1F910E|nr:photosystem II reaction center protein Psb28 [Phormidium sp. CCY1219]MEB3828344.1 photosystem II reaction center protein Psb28 [Phormidium sp. CCY1219]